MKGFVKYMGLIPKLSDCNPGLMPHEYNVLIAPEEIAEKVGSIILTDKSRDADKQAATRGRIIKLSAAAFSYHDFKEDVVLPKVGDAVLFSKFAGVLAKGADDREYRLMKDQDIIAVLENEQ